jgi:hypothetical protein
MSRALIVIGHERRFSENAEHFRHYLRHRAGIRNVKIIPGWNKTEDLLLGLILNQAALAGRQPFLLAYNGHGSKQGWAYGREDSKTWLRLSYERLAEGLASGRKGPTLIVNDCCYADRISKPIRRHAGFGEVGIIAASAVNEVSYCQLGSDVIASWADGKPYRPQVRAVRGRKKPVQETRRGAELDHFFFSHA